MKMIMLHLDRQFSTNWDFVVSKYHQGFTLLQNSKYVINILDKKPNEHHLSVSVSNFGLVIFSVFFWLYVPGQQWRSSQQGSGTLERTQNWSLGDSPYHPPLTPVQMDGVL